MKSLERLGFMTLHIAVAVTGLAYLYMKPRIRDRVALVRAGRRRIASLFASSA